MARRTHVAHSDRQESKRQMNNLDHPVKFAGHERYLRHADHDGRRADDQSAGRDYPAAAFGKSLADSNNQKRSDCQKTEQDMHLH